MRVLDWLRGGTRTRNLEGLVETSITLGYEADKWGTERIALDGIQNHLPSDSKGTKVDVGFLVDGKWTPQASYQNGQVSAIRFSDDGRGYSHELLSVFHSTKKQDTDAVGHFGEGIKMLSAATLREGVDLELRSRDWSAKPTAIDLQIEGEKIKKLAYQVTKKDKIDGSQTIFWNPSQELTDYVKNLGDKVLQLRRGFTPLYETGKRAILDDRGDIFVKGIYITSLFKDRLLFSYGLDVIPNRDRNDIHESTLIDELGRIWSSVSTTAPIKALLGSYETSPQRFASSHEAYTLRRIADSVNKDAWKKAFEEKYGANAIVQTQENIRPIAENLGFKVVHVENQDLRNLLKGTGVRTDIDVLEQGDDLLYLSESFDPSKIRKDVKPTSLSLDYRARNWGALRITLDAIANHMPQDSGGNTINIEYLVQKQDDKGRVSKVWSPQLGYYDKPEAVRVRDDGRGYSLEHLLLLKSTKAEDAVGQFGEGLKMLSTASLREKIPVKFRSRDWFAMPIAQPLVIDGQATERLAYTTVEGSDNTEGSTTTFFNPSYDLLGVFRSIGDYVLHFARDVQELHKDDNGRIIQPSANFGQATYVKGFFMTKNHDREFKTVFSYDLTTQSIAPDRNNIDYRIFKGGIERLLATCENEYVPRRIIEEAKKGSGDYAEFMDLELKGEQVKRVWKNAFESVFDEHTVLDSKNPSANYEAEHLGYKIAYIDEKLSRTLWRSGVKSAMDIAFQNYLTKDVAENELTEQERRTLALFNRVDQVLGINAPVKINIYQSMSDSRGQDLGLNGFYRPSDETINLRRDILSSPREAVRVYTHERGHNVTGAPDPDDYFRMFFEKNLLPFVMRETEQTGVPLDRDSKPFDYDLALKETQKALTEYRIAADGAKKLQTNLADERQQLESRLAGQYSGRIQQLQDDNSRLRDELRKERFTPWYRRIFR